MITTANTITIENILQEIYGSTNTLGRTSTQIFVDAIGTFDSAYKVGDGNNFLSFRGYQHALPDATKSLQYRIMIDNVGGSVHTQNMSDADIKCARESYNYGTGGSSVRYFSSTGFNVGTQLYSYSSYSKTTQTGSYFFGWSGASFTIVHLVNGIVTDIIDAVTITSSCA